MYLQIFMFFLKNTNISAKFNIFFFKKSVNSLSVSTESAIFDGIYYQSRFEFFKKKNPLYNKQSGFTPIVSPNPPKTIAKPPQNIDDQQC